MSGQNETQHIASIETLIREIDKIADPVTRSATKQLVQLLMELHGSGIERMLEITHQRGDAGQQIIDEFGQDGLVKHLLLLYGLHPLDLRSRIVEALEKAAPQLQPHGQKIELLDLSDSGIVRLRIRKQGHSCSSSAGASRSLVEGAIYDAAPEVTGILIEDSEPQGSGSSGFVPLAALQRPELQATVSAVCRDVG